MNTLFDIPDRVLIYLCVAVFFIAVYMRAVLLIEKIERRNFGEIVAYAYINVAYLFPLWIPIFLPVTWTKALAFAICVGLGVLAFRKLENTNADSRIVPDQKRG